MAAPDCQSRHHPDVGFQCGPRHRANVDFRMQVIERSVADHPRREPLLAELRALG